MTELVMPIPLARLSVDGELPSGVPGDSKADGDSDSDLFSRTTKAAQ